MYCCPKCLGEVKDNDAGCPVCDGSDVAPISHEQQIINDEKLRIATRQKEKAKNNLGCTIFIVMIMLMISFVILFVGSGPSFGGLMFVALTAYAIYSMIKTIAS